MVLIVSLNITFILKFKVVLLKNLQPPKEFWTEDSWRFQISWKIRL